MCCRWNSSLCGSRCEIRVKRNPPRARAPRLQPLAAAFHRCHGFDAGGLPQSLQHDSRSAPGALDLGSVRASASSPTAGRMVIGITSSFSLPVRTIDSLATRPVSGAVQERSPAKSRPEHGGLRILFDAHPAPLFPRPTSAKIHLTAPRIRCLYPRWRLAVCTDLCQRKN